MSRPTDDDRAEALRRFLTGVARGDDANQLAAEIAALHVRNNTFPGEMLMELAATRLISLAPIAKILSLTESCCRRICPKLS